MEGSSRSEVRGESHEGGRPPGRITWVVVAREVYINGVRYVGGQIVPLKHQKQIDYLLRCGQIVPVKAGVDRG